MTGTSEAEPGAARAGITIFGPPREAPDLHETNMMSMPEIDPAMMDNLMEWGLSGGNLVKVLFREAEGDGMSLLWSWFGPDHILPRHSHDADCLYFVVAGEARLGNRTVPAGGGFFVPADAPYAYTAGPEGIQILEFRNVGSFDMKITESFGRWDRIVETAREHGEAWREASTHV